MKQKYVILSLVSAFVLTANAGSKFDTESQTALTFYKQFRENPGAAHAVPVELPFELNEKSRASDLSAGVIIKLKEGESFDNVERAGLVIVQKIGDDMCVATGSVEDIISLEDVDAVETLSLGRPLTAHLSAARAASGVDDVQKGTSTTSAYTGKGVICGIYDEGIDPNHINFYDADFTESRVKRFYSFPYDNGTDVAYTTPEQISKVTTDSKSATHGTHTLGCMTGAFCLKGNKGSNYPSGSAAVILSSGGVTNMASTANPYYGTAPGADIFACGGKLYTTNMIAAAGKIVDYAVANNQPCVINFSIGSNGGPHDGSDAFGQAVERLSKNAIFCLSSGNEGEDNISIVKTLTSADRQLKSMIDHSTTSTGVISIYGSDKNTFNFSVAVVDKKTGSIIVEKKYNTEGSTTLATNNYTASGYQHDAQFDKAFMTSYIIVSVSNNSSTNGRHSISMQYNLTANSTTNADGSLVLAIICEGNAGQRVDVVNSMISGNGTLSSNNLSGWSDGNPDFTLNNLACSPNVICVGSWTTSVKWPTVNRTTYQYGAGSHIVLDEVSPFTSYGTLCDGRNLPDICAPGAAIISSYNSYYTGGNSSQDVARYTYNGNTYRWQAEQGTSMASPFCAGVIATWLEANPNLTVQKVKDIMTKTALPLVGKEVKTGPGKLNAIGGLKEVLGQDAVNDVKIESDIIISNNGKVYEVFVTGGGQVDVYNLNGQSVKKVAGKDNTLSVDMSDLNKGIYLLNVNGVHTQKVVLN